MVSQGKRYDLAKDTSVKGISAQGWTSSGLAKDTSVGATNTQLAAGVAPAVSGLHSGEAILQPPASSPVTMYTFPGNGRLWFASVSYAIGTSGGSVFTDQGYARVRVQGGQTLAIVECCVAGIAAASPDSDSNTSDAPYNGLALPNGTVIILDINNGAALTSAVQRASGLVVVSIP